jgi:sugar phosphate isomerase/epimerase
VRELASMLADHDMGCFEIAAMHIGEPGEARAAAREVAAWAAVLKPKWVLSNIGAPIDATMCDTFDDVCTILADSGCRPAIEYLPFTPANSIATSQVLVDHVGRDRAGILFDTWHHFRGPDTWADLEAAPLDLVAYVQFDDAYPMTSEDLPAETVSCRAFPGEGEFDLDRYCSTMRTKGFVGVVSVEILNDGWRANPDLEAFARRAFDTTARYWGR